QPGFGDDEDGEGELDRRAAPVILGVDRIDEQRPAVLQVGDHRHADDAHHELEPTETCAKRRGCNGAIRAGNHQQPPKRLSVGGTESQGDLVSQILWLIVASAACRLVYHIPESKPYLAP